jgi:hypothetical protein
MPGQPAATWSWPGTCALAGLCGHLIQRPQQPQPAGEADFLLRAGPGILPGSADDPKTASRRLGPVQDDTDLHTPIAPAPAAGNISQLADACRTGTATRYEHRDHPPQWRARAPDRVADSQHPAPRPTARRPSVKQTRTGNRPRIAHLSAATRRAWAIPKKTIMPRAPSSPGLGGVPPADRSCLGPRGSPRGSPFPVRSGHEIGPLADAMTLRWPGGAVRRHETNADDLSNPFAFTLRDRCSECVRGRLPLPEALRDELGPLLLACAV